MVCNICPAARVDEDGVGASSGASEGAPWSAPAARRSPAATRGAPGAARPQMPPRRGPSPAPPACTGALAGFEPLQAKKLETTEGTSYWALIRHIGTGALHGLRARCQCAQPCYGILRTLQRYFLLACGHHWLHCLTSMLGANPTSGFCRTLHRKPSLSRKRGRTCSRAAPRSAGAARRPCNSWEDRISPYLYPRKPSPRSPQHQETAPHLFSGSTQERWRSQEAM